MSSLVWTSENSKPIKAWTKDIEPQAKAQLENLAKMPFIHKHIAVMPDVHAGIGSTVGSVIATKKAIIPAAVGVDIGCGMAAGVLHKPNGEFLRSTDLPTSLSALRSSIERGVPLGAGGAVRHDSEDYTIRNRALSDAGMFREQDRFGDGFYHASEAIYNGDTNKAAIKASQQLGTLGSGNHFIEICLDESDRVWLMLHSGSRGIGNMIGRAFIEKAKLEMERWHIHLPDGDLAYLPEGSEHFNAYVEAVNWAQEYALMNREYMFRQVLRDFSHTLKLDIHCKERVINCHHNYVELENHFGENVYVTRKGAVRARKGEFGIIPGSMGARSYIVMGKGNPESFCSCSHGAGRKMSRSEAKRRFTVDDLKKATEGVECRKDADVIDEIPQAYKDIDEVMANQADLVEPVITLRQILCIKG